LEDIEDDDSNSDWEQRRMRRSRTVSSSSLDGDNGASYDFEDWKSRKGRG